MLENHSIGSLSTGNRRPAGGRAWLFHLGNQGVADHDLRHPLGEFENIVPHPSAAFSLEANASSALSNMLIVISTSGPPSSR